MLKFELNLRLLFHDRLIERKLMNKKHEHSAIDAHIHASAFLKRYTKLNICPMTLSLAHDFMCNINLVVQCTYFGQFLFQKG